MLDTRIEIVLKQIEFARGYTLSLLADVADADWFAMPPGAASHIAWQMGHIAMAEYGLCLFRQRGRQPEDLELMTSTFRKQFSRGSVPEPDPAKNPSIGEIRSTFDRVHEQVLKELPLIVPSSLADPVDLPYAGYPTKFGALLLASHHEMVHAGQIGVLRRLLGKQPVR
jgi:hypothetical protein